MKSSHLIIYTLLLVLILGAFKMYRQQAEIAELTNLMYSNTPDEEGCPYEKGECVNSGCSNYGYGYQVYLTDTATIVKDGPRLVGILPVNWEHPSAIDSLFLKDNL